MAFTVIQAGDGLQLMDETGMLTPLTLPTGVSLLQATPPRWAVFDRYVVLVNTPEQPLIIDGNGTVRLLCPAAPRVGSVLTSVSGGTLTGTYSGVRYTFITQDSEGNLISESDYSPPSNSVTFTTDFLKASNLDISPDDITGRRLYRPTSGGATLFQWVDLDGNVLTSIQDDLSDAGLSLVASPTLGTPPYLTHIGSFRGRLFGAGPDDLDHVRFTEAGIRYAWPADNLLEIPIVGSDQIGITGFLQRREALGVGRKNQLVQITGSGTEDSFTGTIDFDVVIVSKELGITSQESVAVYRDTGYFLWDDGVYEWGPDGLTCISDGAGGKGMVRSWFATDNYFDRSRFDEAFGVVDPIRNKYRLFLFDSDGEIWWVEYDLRNRTWWGPHKTDAFTPTSTFLINLNNTNLPMIGGDDGNVYQEQIARVDGTSTPIDMRVIVASHDGEEPDLDKYFGEFSVLGAGRTIGTLDVLTTVGEMNETAQYTQEYDLSKSRQRLSRLGVGKFLTVEFRHDNANEEVELLGYEVAGVHIVGRR